MSSLKVFSDKLVEFLDSLCETFGTDLPDLPAKKEQVVLLKKTNPRVLCNLFQYYCGAYIDRIAQRDITVIQEMCENEENTFFRNMDIYGLMRSCDDEITKDAIWKYLHMLCILANRVE